jgi:putative molybdopterin biosynthesis protein
MSDQEQFLDVIDRDEAERRFRSALTLAPLGIEKIAVRDALGRVLADNVIARVDVPSFDRSNFDGYAIRAVDTQSASELVPRSVHLLSESLEAGMAPTMELGPGQAISISTGGMLPRGRSGWPCFDSTIRDTGLRDFVCRYRYRRR